MLNFGASKSWVNRWSGPRASGSAPENNVQVCAVEVQVSAVEVCSI